LPAVDRVPRAIEVIDRVGDGVQVTEELSAGDPAHALDIRLEETVPERAVRQLHADDQEILDLPGSVHDQQAGVLDAPGDLQGAQLAGPEIGGEVDELQRDAMTAGGLRFPHFGDPAAAPLCYQPIPGDLRVAPQNRVEGPGVTLWLHGPPLQNAGR